MADWTSDPVQAADFIDVLLALKIIDDGNQALRQPYKFHDLAVYWAQRGYPLPGDDEWEDFVSSISSESEEIDEDEEEDEEDS